MQSNSSADEVLFCLKEKNFLKIFIRSHTVVKLYLFLKNYETESILPKLRKKMCILKIKMLRPKIFQYLPLIVIKHRFNMGLI